MQELVANIHIHSLYSDGSKNHQDIISTAQTSGIDVLIFTDHNIAIKDIEGYYGKDRQKVMVIMGQEIHDASAMPQKNHMLALGINKSLAMYAKHRQNLVYQIHQHGGAAFLAHPFDPALPDFHEPDISWEDWSLEHFDGIELWNGFSELKGRSRNKLDTYFFAFFPNFLPLKPPEKTIQKWDDLHRSGKKVSAIGGSDAHGLKFSAGPFYRTIFPYGYHFSTINNHILLNNEVSGNFEGDKSIVIQALAAGKNFIANDLIGRAIGFRFFISQQDEKVMMGESAKFSPGQYIHLAIPDHAEIAIKKNGRVIKSFNGKGNFQCAVGGPGVYRIECYKRSRNKKRGWIFSNPIYVS